MKRKGRFNIGRWAKAHPRKMAAARRRGSAHRIRIAGSRAIANVPRGIRARGRAILTRILGILDDHERRIRALEGR